MYVFGINYIIIFCVYQFCLFFYLEFMHNSIDDVNKIQYNVYNKKCNSIFIKEKNFMANTINVNIRVDEELKKQTEVLLSEMGLNMTTAVNIFLRQVLRTGGIPFEITTRTDDFYNPINQQRLRNSIDRLESGLGKVHELIEVDE